MRKLPEIAIALLAAALWMALQAAAPKEPEVISVFPFGGQRGSAFQAKIRGRSLERAAAIWFDCEHLSATISGVENDPAATPPTKKK